MKRKKGGEGGANWMDTYGDMVTLLLCFFVLLYSISSVDEKKWLALVQSFNPNAIYDLTETSGEGGASAEDYEGMGMEEQNAEMEQEEIDEAIEQLYQALIQYTQSSSAESSIDIVKGDGYVFISFDDAVFFNGDSYVLRDEGVQLLTNICSILDGKRDFIDEIRVMGHTAQANPDRPNTPMVDRFLSSNRATEAAVFLQQHTQIKGERIVTVGYGQHRPIDSNATAETRSHNRRVEIVITGLNVEDMMGDAVEQYYTTRAGGPEETGSREYSTAEGAPAPDGQDTQD